MNVLILVETLGHRHSRRYGKAVVEIAFDCTHSPRPLYEDFAAAGATHESDLRRRVTFFGQLMREQDDLAVESS